MSTKAQTINMNLVKLFLFHLSWLQIGSARDPIVNEIIKFCQAKGFKFLSIFNMVGSDLQIRFQLLNLSSVSGIRSRILQDNSQMEELSFLNQPIDTSVMLFEDQDKFFETVHKHKIKNTIVVIDDSDLVNFKEKASYFAKNCYFYLLTKTSSNNFTWNSVIILNNINDVFINDVKLSDKNDIIEKIDFKGTELIGNALTWLPDYGFNYCNDKYLKCDNFGLLVDMINVWKTESNFTWDIFVGYPNKDWGISPKSGKETLKRNNQ